MVAPLVSIEAGRNSRVDGLPLMFCDWMKKFDSEAPGALMVMLFPLARCTIAVGNTGLEKIRSPVPGVTGYIPRYCQTIEADIAPRSSLSPIVSGLWWNCIRTRWAGSCVLAGCPVQSLKDCMAIVSSLCVAAVVS